MVWNMYGLKRCTVHDYSQCLVTCVNTQWNFKISIDQPWFLQSHMMYIFISCFAWKHSVQDNTIDMLLHAVVLIKVFLLLELLHVVFKLESVVLLVHVSVKNTNYLKWVVMRICSLWYLWKELSHCSSNTMLLMLDSNSEECYFFQLL